MNLNVLFEVRARREALVAGVANVRFLTSVDSLMSYQVTYLKERSEYDSDILL